VKKIASVVAILWGGGMLLRGIPAAAPPGYVAGLMMSKAIGLLFVFLGAQTLYKAYKGNPPSETEPATKSSWALYAAFVGCFLLIVALLARRTLLNAYAGFNMGLAQSARMRGDTAGEERGLDRVLRLEPTFPPALAQRAALRLARGDADGALADADAALKRDDRFWQAHQVRCGAYAAKGDADNTVSACETAASMLADPGQIAGIRMILGDAWFAKKEFLKSIASYDEALKAQPTLNVALARRGFARMMIGPKEQALEDLLKAARTDAKIAAEYGKAISAAQAPGWTPVVPSALGAARLGLLGLGRLELLYFTQAGRWATIQDLSAMPATRELLAVAAPDLETALKAVFRDGAVRIEATGERLSMTATALDPRATSLTIQGDPQGLQLPELTWELGKFDAAVLSPPPKPKRRKRA
jgi:tetratricopeptide (TPR) repeat protein